jgi:aldehyde oxidoreductase
MIVNKLIIKNYRNFKEAEADLNDSLNIFIGENGQGADMGTLYHAYDALMPLGLEPEQIRLVMNDTEKTPNSGPAGGSRSTVTTGNATRVACENLVKALRKPDGTYMTYDEVVAKGLPTRYEGKWSVPGTDQDVVTGQGNPFANYMYGVLLAEVKVDMNTGKATVEQLTIIADVGKVGNKLLTDGQIYGGLAQGIGLALTEDYEDINYHTTFTKAGMPQIKDVPDNIRIIYQETERPDGSRGSSGVGEMPLSAPHAAIVNAIYDACGVRITKLPALPEKILAGLKNK